MKNNAYLENTCSNKNKAFQVTFAQKVYGSPEMKTMTVAEPASLSTLHKSFTIEPPHRALASTRMILEPRNGSLWNPEEQKTLRDRSLTPASRIILEHKNLGSASKASFVS